MYKKPLKKSSELLRPAGFANNIIPIVPIINPKTLDAVNFSSLIKMVPKMKENMGVAPQCR